MKTKFYFIIAILCAIQFLQTSRINAQTLCTHSNISIAWAHSFGHNSDDIAFGMTPIDADNDGVADDGCVLVGEAYSNSTGFDVFVLRLDANGDSVWGKTFDGGASPAQADVAYAVVETSTDSLLICGVTKTNYFGSPKNQNFWVLKLDLNGNVGWKKEYGADNSQDIAYDIKEDHDGNYVVVGTATRANNDLSGDTIQNDGDYWVLKLSPGGSKIWQATYYSNVSGINKGNDFARSVVVDCDGNYVVTGFCKSCEASGTKQDLLMLKISSSNGSKISPFPKIYGKAGADHGSFNVIQPYDSSYGTCSSSDGIFSLGISHYNGYCFGSAHDLWAQKINNSGTDSWTATCPNDVIDGIIYGGTKLDDGFSSALTCNGYLLAGITKSNDNDVSCNNATINPGPSPYLEDIWLAKVNSSTGAIDWNESLGDTCNDGAYVIKRVPDGSYIVAGYDSFTVAPCSTYHGGYDFYVAKFEIISEECLVPELLEPENESYCGVLSWIVDPCIPRYVLQYRKTTSATWITVDPATSPYYLTSPYSSGGTEFEWQVISYCSPSNYSYSSGSNFYMSYCSGSVVDCNCQRLGSGDSQTDYNDLLSVYPNPSDGSFEISLQLNDDYNGLASIAVLDQVGKIVYSTIEIVENGLLESPMKFINLPSGFYWLTITIAGRPYKTKLVLQKQ